MDRETADRVRTALTGEGVADEAIDLILSGFPIDDKA